VCERHQVEIPCCIELELGKGSSATQINSISNLLSSSICTAKKIQMMQYDLIKLKRTFKHDTVTAKQPYDL